MTEPAPVVQTVVPLQPPPPVLWKKKFPTIFSSILSFLQFGITVVIVGCEIGSILIDMVTATIYVGIWASLFFISAWVSQAASSCCCRDRGCATYTLITQIIALFFAACVIGFDSFYLVYPTTCFFSSNICTGSASVRGLFYTSANFYDIKIPLIKGQLAAGAVMFVLCLISITIYIITTIRLHRAKKSPIIHPPVQFSSPAQFSSPSQYSLPSQYPLPVATVGPDGMLVVPPVLNIRPPKPGSPLYHRPMIVVDNGEGRTNDLLCPSCSTMMVVTVRKRPPQ